MRPKSPNHPLYRQKQQQPNNEFPFAPQVRETPQRQHLASSEATTSDLPYEAHSKKHRRRRPVLHWLVLSPPPKTAWRPVSYCSSPTTADGGWRTSRPEARANSPGPTGDGWSAFGPCRPCRRRRECRCDCHHHHHQHHYHRHRQPIPSAASAEGGRAVPLLALGTARAVKQSKFSASHCSMALLLEKIKPRQPEPSKDTMHNSITFFVCCAPNGFVGIYLLEPQPRGHVMWGIRFWLVGGSRSLEVSPCSWCRGTTHATRTRIAPHSDALLLA